MNSDEKHIYPIGVAARMLDISVPTIRLYEREGLIILQKNQSGRRMLSEFDIERLRCIRYHIVDEGLNLRGIRKLMAILPCWEMKQECTKQHYSSCPAYLGMDGPCWSLPDKPGICEHADCYQCTVYRKPFKCEDLKTFLHGRTLHQIDITES